MRAFPRAPLTCAAHMIRRVKDERGYNYVIEFPRAILFTDSDQHKKSVWFNVNKEEHAGDAERAAWDYFVEVQRRFAREGMRPEWAGLPAPPLPPTKPPPPPPGWPAPFQASALR